MQTATHPLHVVARITAAIFGSYVFTWGCATLSISGLVTLGLPYEEASIGTMLLAFLIYLSAFLWSFAATSLARVWLVLGIGGATMIALAWWLQLSLLG